VARLSVSAYGSFLMFTARSKVIRNDRGGSIAFVQAVSIWLSVTSICSEAS